MNENYVDTFITVAEDCPVTAATVPPPKKNGVSVAEAQYDMLVLHPYTFTQRDVIFTTSGAVRGNPDLPDDELARLREDFFAKGQACLRASPLPKRFGWGIHFDAEGRAAAYAVDSADYQRLSGDPSLTHLRAMRSKRA